MQVNYNRLYRWTSGPWRPLGGEFVFWLHSSRPSSLGGYVGHIVEAYQRSPGVWSPGWKQEHFNVPMDQLTPYSE